MTQQAERWTLVWGRLAGLQSWPERQNREGGPDTNQGPGPLLTPAQKVTVWLLLGSGPQGCVHTCLQRPDGSQQSRAPPPHPPPGRTRGGAAGVLQGPSHGPSQLQKAWMELGGGKRARGTEDSEPLPTEELSDSHPSRSFLSRVAIHEAPHIIVKYLNFFLLISLR